MANRLKQQIIDAPDPQKIRNPTWMYKFLHDLWARTGGNSSAVQNLTGLESSVQELNTLVGIKDNVQKQLDEKEDSANLGTMAFQDSFGVSINGGTIIGTSISGSVITIPVGTSLQNATIGGILHRDMTAVGNVGVGEDTLISYTMPANVLDSDLQHLEILAFGTVAANANNKEIKLKFGSTTVISTGSVAANSGSWEITARIIRVSSVSQKAITNIISDNSLIIDSVNYTTTSETTSNNIVISCTGEATNDNDIVQEGLILKWYSN